MPHSQTSTLSFRARPSLVSRLVAAVTNARTRRRDRRILAGLDAHLLRDIGLTPDGARTEVAKPFWQP
jgi:uncharacterized protein YjiS (DUF1127 family)